MAEPPPAAPHQSAPLGIAEPCVPTLHSISPVSAPYRPPSISDHMPPDTLSEVSPKATTPNGTAARHTPWGQIPDSELGPLLPYRAVVCDCCFIFVVVAVGLIVLARALQAQLPLSIDNSAASNVADPSSMGAFGADASDVSWFIHVSDLHTTSSAESVTDKGDTPPDNPNEAFETFAGSLDALQPSFVLITGDLTHNRQGGCHSGQLYCPVEADWQEYQSIVTEYGLDDPTYWVDMRGNHDTYAVRGAGSPDNRYCQYGVSAQRPTHCRAYLGPPPIEQHALSDVSAASTVGVSLDGLASEYAETTTDDTLSNETSDILDPQSNETLRRSTATGGEVMLPGPETLTSMLFEDDGTFFDRTQTEYTVLYEMLFRSFGYQVMNDHEVTNRFYPVIYDAPDTSRCDVVLSASHYPLELLADGGSVSSLLAEERVSYHLSGHWHKKGNTGPRRLPRLPRRTDDIPPGIDPMNHLESAPLPSAADAYTPPPNTVSKDMKVYDLELSNLGDNADLPIMRVFLMEHGQISFRDIVVGTDSVQSADTEGSIAVSHSTPFVTSVFPPHASYISASHSLPPLSQCTHAHVVLFNIPTAISSMSEQEGEGEGEGFTVTMTVDQGLPGEYVSIMTCTVRAGSSVDEDSEIGEGERDGESKGEGERDSGVIYACTAPLPVESETYTQGGVHRMLIELHLETDSGDMGISDYIEYPFSLDGSVQPSMLEAYRHGGLIGMPRQFWHMPGISTLFGTVCTSVDSFSVGLLMLWGMIAVMALSMVIPRW
ncbi:hypothetical protein KIPB_006670 [Kipferlia bialata]|uniref:Calcineurin-like phosphoesterase domain-containing protein n=1 Tax=Kipferlia bialata TaxID=797122 RepID=A0A9K3CXD2_9EUKA|nr:hypothetical protein KIPB_006670 [Kipferlia bialata]|eukprot:g6670.t1